MYMKGVLNLFVFQSLNRNPQHAISVLCCTDRKQNPLLFKQLLAVDSCHPGNVSYDVSTEVQVSEAVEPLLMSTSHKWTLSEIGH